jgi:hypothetical protein
LLGKLGARLGGRRQETPQHRVAALRHLAVIASLITHGGKHSMADEVTEETLPREVRLVSFLPDPAYWLALGEFVEAFAYVELLLFIYLSHLSGMPSKSARALLSGRHADQFIKDIRRFWQINPPTARLGDKLDAALTHLTLINAIRSSVVHNVSHFVPGTLRISSNMNRALTEKHTKRYRISSYILKDMSIDMRGISQLLFLATLVQQEPELGDALMEMAWPSLSDAWLYKPSEDHTRPTPQRSNPRRRKGRSP